MVAHAQSHSYIYGEEAAKGGLRFLAREVEIRYSCQPVSGGSSQSYDFVNKLDERLRNTGSV
jgi:hypothetical protein